MSEPTNMRDAADQVVWSPDRQTIVTAGGSKKYEGKIWDVITGQLKVTFPMVAKEAWNGGYNHLDHVSFHPSLPLLTATNNNFARLWNPTTGEQLQTLEDTVTADNGPRTGGCW